MAALTTTILERHVMGALRVHFGIAANNGTGGEIDTGLKQVIFMALSMNHTAVMADAPAVNETLPCDGRAVTVVTTSSPGGNLAWMAVGYP